MQRYLLCLAAVTAGLLQHSYSSAIAYERPVQSAILSLLVSALAIRLAIQWYPGLFNVTRDEAVNHERVALKHSSLDVSGVEGHKQSSVVKDHTKTIVFAILLLALRVDIFRRIRNSEECTSRSYEAFVPFLLSVYDSRSQPVAEIKSNETPDSSIYDDMSSGLWAFMLRPKWRYVPSAFAIAVGCYGLTCLRQGQVSTVVCTIQSGHAAWIPRLQMFALIIDGLLAMMAHSLLSVDLSLQGNIEGMRNILKVLIGAIGAWVIITLGLLIQNVHDIPSMLLLEVNERASYLWSMVEQATLVAAFLLSTLYLIRQYGIFPTSVLITVVTTVLPSIYFIWSARLPYPVIRASTAIWSFSIIIVGVWLHLRIRRFVSPTEGSNASLNIVLLLLVLFLTLWPEMTKNSSVSFHPIDLLMYDARAQHDQYLRFATYSNDLNSAVTLYQSRYQFQPPPGFDIWWEFARKKQVLITDDFDQIHVDLLPFRAVQPRELRSQTKEIASNPWNDIAGISIRGGKVRIPDSTFVTQRWMLDGIVSLIDTFAQHLPDMDLAFNLNELPRVAVPEKEFLELRSQIKRNGNREWLRARDADWSTASEHNTVSSVFEDWSLQNTFDQFGSIGCPSGSPARKTHHNVFQPFTCTSCALPHSLGHFMSNWSLAANPCHQPDLGQLYGTYMSPASFKPTHALRPVFSQAKMHGFSDILYPSSWNYLEKVSYNPTVESNDTSTVREEDLFPDPPLTQKVNSLYWRGTTNEGISSGNRLWRGMARQRLVHMANNRTTSYHDHVTVLLPDPGHDGRFSYQTLSAAEFLHLGLQTDVHIEDHIAQCAGSDCTDQEQELGTVAPSDFQQHWKYRYVLDLDGAGSTGHLIPFMKSHSVPFKAGMSREWYDSRLTPWRHFVPQDLRFHGLWSTLAYFAGVDGSVGKGGRQVKWDAHLHEAEIIAEEGRDWANKVLRKEDMEVYMFRLLLEWGRLTDDRRDELGFHPD